MRALEPGSSKLAAASLGLGAASLVGHLLAWGIGARAGENVAFGDPLVLAAGVTFWLSVLMVPAAIVCGIAAKVRKAEPGWWSTAGLVTAGVSLVLLLIDAVLVLSVLG